MPTYNENQVDELKLFAENDWDLYRQRIYPVHKNLMRKIAAGTYNHELAKKLWKYVADDAAKRYGKEFGSGDGFKIFSPADRKAVAEVLADEFKDAADAHEYDNLIPKKYKGYEDEEEEEGPQEGDIVVESSGHLGSQVTIFEVGGKEIFRGSADEAEVNKKIKAYVKKSPGFFPAIWNVSDHGNVSPRGLSGYKSGNGSASASPFTEEATQAFIAGYVMCALWSSSDESDESGGRPLDENYVETDIAAESADKMREDCIAFLVKAEGPLNDARYAVGESWIDLMEKAGHDFWLTRNGHGAGFWDGDWPEDLGEELTKISKSFGESDLYIGDDGDLYITP